MDSPAKLLVILVNETDQWNEMSLYEAICRKLIKLNAPGATVQSGIMGFGINHHIHRKRLFGVPDDRPITISVVAPESDIREKLVPALKPMVLEGLMFVLDVEVL